MKKGFVNMLLLISLFAVSVAFAYFYGIQKGKSEDLPVPQATVSPEQPAEISPEQAQSTIMPSSAPTSNIPSGWTTFTSDQYGFSISFPPSYKALTDSNNLYGWPNGVVLIYEGGQSYDLAVEHWGSQAEYENKYRNQTNVTVKKVGDVYITLLNTNLDAKVDEIIGTFREL